MKRSLCIADTKTTGAHEFLKFNGIDTLVIGGLALDFCVKKSVMQALDLGYNVVVNLASTRAVLPDMLKMCLQSSRIKAHYLSKKRMTSS